MGVGQSIREGFTLSVVVRFGGEGTNVGHGIGRHAEGDHRQTFERFS